MRKVAFVIYHYIALVVAKGTRYTMNKPFESNLWMVNWRAQGVEDSRRGQEAVRASRKRVFDSCLVLKVVNNP